MLAGRDIAIGILVGSAVLFVVEIAPVIRHAELRAPLEPSQAPQSDLDAFISSALAFTAMGVTMYWTAEAFANPGELSL